MTTRDAESRGEVPAGEARDRACLMPLESSQIAFLEPHLQRVSYEPGERLWNQGKGPGRLTVIRKGRVRIVRTRQDGSAVFLYVFGPGTVFGFLPMIDEGPYPASAEAVDEVEADVMEAKAFREVIESQPEAAWPLLRALGRRLRGAFDRIEALSHREAKIRVASSLLALLPQGKLVRPIVVSLPGPAYQFAEQIGVAPETFSRVVTSLVSEGVIHRLSGGALQILDLDQLRGVAGHSGE